MLSKHCQFLTYLSHRSSVIERFLDGCLVLRVASAASLLPIPVMEEVLSRRLMCLWWPGAALCIGTCSIKDENL